MKLYALLFSVGVYLTSVEARKRPVTHDDFQFVEDHSDKNSSPASSDSHITWILDPDNALCGLLLCGKRELCLLQDRFTAVCVNKAEVTRNGDKIVPLKQATLDEWNDRLPYDDDDDDVEDDDDELYDDEDDYDEEDDEEDDFLEEDLADENPEKVNQQNDSDEIKDTDVDGLGKQRLNRGPFVVKKCQSCPVVRPTFICGSDNRTYSSLCRLHYHNCIHEANVNIACKGFCPCQDTNHNRPTKKDSQRSHKGNHKFSMAERRARKQNKETYKGYQKSYKSKHSSKHSNYPKADKRAWGIKTNDIDHKASNSVWGPNECSQDALAAMGNRMLDWFSVIMSDARAKPLVNSKAPSWCKPEVAWMLFHLDSDGDSQLSVKELYQLEHDERERCIKPFIDRCDLDRDAYLSGREWCKCFDKSERPCAALRRASKGLLGGYIPECDSEGYYRPTQCHLTANMCWCVDKHGVEKPGSRTRSSPNCEAVMSPELIHNRVDDEDDDVAEEIEGSADMPLDI